MCVCVYVYYYIYSLKLIDYIVDKVISHLLHAISGLSSGRCGVNSVGHAHTDKTVHFA